MKTPTLIMFGTRDTNVPTGQGWEHFRAMRQTEAAPVRFILFPGAGHGPVKLSHRKRKISEELAWIDRYLLGEEKPLNEAFDESYEIPEGTENWPASGIFFKEAADYCKWLSGKTGRKYRLPKEEEMEKLIGAAAGNVSNENNLDWWAGYTLTPDEVPYLMDKVAELEEHGLLLKECGSFPPVGKKDEPGVWDLAGNIAEWTVTEDGKGKVLRTLGRVSPRQALRIRPSSIGLHGIQGDPGEIAVKRRVHGALCDK